MNPNNHLANIPNVQVETLADYTHLKPTQSNSSFGFWDYLNARTDYNILVACCKLFYPDLVEVGPYIFLAERYSPNQLESWEARRLSHAQIEATINHVHIYDLLTNHPTEYISPDMFELVGRTLAICWKHTLTNKFPNRRFHLDYQTEPEAYGPTITFHQIR